MAVGLKVVGPEAIDVEGSAVEVDRGVVRRAEVDSENKNLSKEYCD